MVFDGLILIYTKQENIYKTRDLESIIFISDYILA